MKTSRKLDRSRWVPSRELLFCLRLAVVSIAVSLLVTVTDRMFDYRWCFRSHEEWCERLAGRFRAKAGVTLSDGSKVDLLNSYEVYAVVLAQEWESAVGRALSWARATSRRPAIVLLVSDRAKYSQHVERCRNISGQNIPAISVYDVDIP